MTDAVHNKKPITCTLEPDDMRLRLARIRELSMRTLRGHTQRGRTLQLHFAPEASAEVRALVEDEQKCCPFLTIELTAAPDGLHLSVTAPEEAREFGPLLFSHFVPAPVATTFTARQASSCGCGPRCG